MPVKVKLSRVLCGVGLSALIAGGGATAHGGRRAGKSADVVAPEAAGARVIQLRAGSDVYEASLSGAGIDAARALLVGIAPRVARAPVDARLDLDAHARVPEVPGRELDVEASLSRLLSARAGSVVELSTRVLPARVTLASLGPVRVDKVLSAYETTFSLAGAGPQRAANIRRSAAALDGIVIEPGQTLSFNAIVGPRTPERGFEPAPELQRDELHLGYGGGTCQTSSTLHAAAIFGALEVVERQPHAHPSTYIPIGLDATVSYPLADLKIRNPLPFPLMIHAWSPRPDAVRVELLGGDPVARVEYAYDVGLGQSFGRRVEIKPGMSSGARVLHQRGVPGANVTSVVTIHYVDGRDDLRRYPSAYRPAPEVYWMAPGADAQTLPALFGG